MCSSDLKARIMHVETSLLNRVGDFRAGKSKILESTGETTIERGIGTWFTIGGKFGTSVYRGARGLAIEHTSARKDI